MTVGAVKPLKKAFCCGLPGWKNEVRLIVPRTSPQRPQTEVHSHYKGVWFLENRGTCFKNIIIIYYHVINQIIYLVT
jgi:hypothetical protein